MRVNFYRRPKTETAIARSIFNKEKNFILDEATNALDKETEAQIMMNLSKLSEFTKLIVTHRVETLKDCDQIPAIDNGQLIEKGSFEELKKIVKISIIASR